MHSCHCVQQTVILLCSILCFCGYSDFVKRSVSNVTEPSPAPELEVPQENPNPNHLHRFVSEGDAAGVRLVGITAHPD